MRCARSRAAVLVLAAAFARAAPIQEQAQIGAPARVRLPVDGARETGGEAFAFVEVSADRARYFAHQPIHVKLQLGLELAFSKTNLLQLFTQPLDVPVQLQAPWTANLEGAESLDDPVAQATEPRGTRKYSLVLDDQITDAVRVADTERNEHSFAVFEIERTYAATRSGPLEISAPRARFAYATQFEPTILSDALPVDWRLATVHGERLELAIEPLPETDRPSGFTGAVGRFEIAAEAREHSVAVGESVHVALAITGEGNLQSFGAPRLDDLRGFHVRGVLDDKGRERRTFTYDLAPSSADVKTIPPIEFAYFDPSEPAGYRTLRTEAIALDVRPGPIGPGAGMAVTGSLTALVVTAIALVALVAGVVAFAIAKLRRRASGAPRAE